MVIRGRLYEVWEVYGTLGVITDRLYEVWEVYGDPRGSLEVVYMSFGKYMGTQGGHKGSFT